MAVPVINDIAGLMTTYLESPVAEVSFKLQHDLQLACDVSASGFQYAFSSASGVWYDGTLDSSTTGLAMPSYVSSPGRSTLLRWDVKTDLDGYSSEEMLFRLMLTDASGVASSGYYTTDPFNIYTADPSGVSFSLDPYTNVQSLSFAVTASGNATYYKTAETSAFSGASWQAYTAPSGTAGITLTTLTEESKSVYVKLRDAYYNTSTTASDTILMHTTAPANTYLKINGTVSDETVYTGIDIATDGSFSPDRTVILDIYAEDYLDLEIYIDGDIDDQSDVRSWITYKTSATVTLTGTDYDYDADSDISVTFRDAATNTTVATKTIRCNTRVFECDNRLLREPSSEYDHVIIEVTQQGSTSVVSETQSLAGTFTRRWDDIFYPTTHSYPVDQDGDLDESLCIAMNGASTTSYDAVQISSGAVVYDSEGRATTVDWTDDATKDYSNLESSYIGNFRYWIIDNTGYGDVDLEFEHFYLDPNSYGPPYNNMSPYTGDHVALYDATAAGATQAVLGARGETTYTLLDSSKLTELYAYSGKGNQVIELSTGYSVNADVNGGFEIPTIRGISRICLILYSDASTAASGFKFKAGEKHERTFSNYHVDETVGEVWLHKYPTGQSYSGALRMIYDYYDTEIDVDLDAGQVTFLQDPSGVVTSDYTHYVNEADRVAQDYTRLFTASTDDLVDYLDPAMYVTPSGAVVNKVATYVHGYPTSASPSGKVAANYTLDKDRGLVEFSNGTTAHGDEYAFVPSGRLSLDYYHHTYKRLTNDGFGTLIFRDSTIVADDTPLFPDYTWIDVKLVNEGDAILEDGKLKFLARGYDNDNDGTIDQVLDVNRPWDIQVGTATETYDKSAMEVKESYTFDSFCTKTAARTILSTWKNASFGFDVSARTVFYGRVVWVIGGTGGSSYPATTVGRKVFSAEIEGKYYNIDT